VLLDEAQRLEGQDSLDIQGVGRRRRLGDVSVTEVAEHGNEEAHGEEDGT
jgi:hypothetical protein